MDFGGDLGQHLLERSWIRSGVISCAPYTSFDEINDSVVKCKRGALVRDSNPSVVYSAHTTAGDV